MNPQQNMSLETMHAIGRAASAGRDLPVVEPDRIEADDAYLCKVEHRSTGMWGWTVFSPVSETGWTRFVVASGTTNTRWGAKREAKRRVEQEKGAIPKVEEFFV